MPHITPEPARPESQNGRRERVGRPGGEAGDVRELVDRLMHLLVQLSEPSHDRMEPALAESVRLCNSRRTAHHAPWCPTSWELDGS